MHNSAFNLQVILVFPSEVSGALKDLKMQMYDLASYSFTLASATRASLLYLEKKKTECSQSGKNTNTFCYENVIQTELKYIVELLIRQLLCFPAIPYLPSVSLLSLSLLILVIMFHVWHIQYTVYWHTFGYVIAFFLYTLSLEPSSPFQNKWQGKQAV